jgi:hypothetical protein
MLNAYHIIPVVTILFFMDVPYLLAFIRTVLTLIFLLQLQTPHALMSCKFIKLLFHQ